MKPFRVVRGVAAPLDRDDVDTDQIIPKQFLKRIGREGFGEFLFHDSDFVLNADASILIAGRNFGCGSSREHAAWALAGHGFRAIIAVSFADIFAANCLKNGLLPVALPAAREWMKCSVVTVDLERCVVHDDAGLEASFTIDAFHRRCLLEGLDEIDLTLRHEEEIAKFELRNQMY